MKPAHREPRNSCSKKKTDTPQISPEEKARRADAVRQSLANIELEGFVISQETKDLAQRYIDGEITLEELVKG